MTERAEQLRSALLVMVDRFGGSIGRSCAPDETVSDRIRNLRAARRQYMAIMRLSRALAELSART